MSEAHRIGIFGGTFDPIHNTHLDIAYAALEEAALEKVLFLVAASPPHKKGMVATPEQRYAMVEAAVADEPAFEPCDVELNRTGPSYTADTLRELNARYPNAKLFLIMGLDSLIDFPNWREPDAIMELADILAVTRPGNGTPVPDSLSGHYQLLPFTESSVSSTAIRSRVDSNQSLENLVPPAIEEIIREEGIYRD